MWVISGSIHDMYGDGSKPIVPIVPCSSLDPRLPGFLIRRRGWSGKHTWSFHHCGINALFKTTVARRMYVYVRICTYMHVYARICTYVCNVMQWKYTQSRIRWA